MSATAEYERPPDAVITASCAIDEGSFADVDSDGIDDLVLRSGAHVFSWPSSRGPGAPLVWSWSNPGESSWIDVSTPNAGSPRVNWLGIHPDSSFQYEVDLDTLALILVVSGERVFQHVGDVDGDGAADSYGQYFNPDFPLAVRASSTGLYTTIPGWGYSTYEPWPYETVPYYAWSVGDINHDGYDDLLVGQRDWEEDPDVDDSRSTGPAQLYLGSASGIEPEPLWTLSAPGNPMAGVGRGVAALPDEGAIVVTVVTEGLFNGDYSTELLGVIRSADTPDAYFDQLVEVPEITPGGFTPYLLGWMNDGTGQPALAMSEVTGSTGVQWFPWFADGFHPDENGVAVPSAWWAPPGLQALEPYLSFLSFPVGRHQQAVLEGLYSESGYQLVEWGRPLDQLGIPPEGVAAAGCCFTASEYVDGGPWEPCDPADFTPAPEPAADEGGCGCDSARGQGWLAGVVALLGSVARRRRQATA